MKKIFPPEFVTADFAGLPKAKQEDYEGKPQPPCQPREFADESLKIAREYWEMEKQEKD